MKRPTRRRTPNSTPSSTSKPRRAAGALPPPTPSEAAFEELLEHFDELDPPDGSAPLRVVEAAAPIPERDEPAAFLDDLFAKSATYLSREPFASIGDADAFYTKVVGVSFEGRQDVVAGLEADAPVALVREPENVHDPFAIAVRFGHLQIGYLRSAIAKRVAPNIDAGDRYEAVIASLSGGGPERHAGVNLHVRRHRRAPARAAAFRDPEHAGDATDVRAALIGDRPVRDAQRLVLDRVADGRNTLAVMGTGRGKSFCFQLPAAERALQSGAKTLVFYPLRALANDQFEALLRRLSAFGLRILRANGSIDGDERAALELALEDGSWDVLLATPEFATYHRERFERACNRPSLVVVDEAHHLYESRHRAAYATLGALVAALGSPQVLALTATARADAFAYVRDALRIDAWVIDPTVRENLHLVDARGRSDKLDYLHAELAGDGKAIVYCNSRPEAAKIAERLRRKLGGAVAFYHAGVPSAERARVEELFRSGDVRTIVATSAFGEGIDLPDVRDVFLYHLNFDFTEFNQQAGRAGRDGADARIHLLYGESDRRLNDFIIARSAPSVATLRDLYRGMRGLAQGDVVRMTYEDVARTLSLDFVAGETVSTAVRVWEEAGLVETGRDDDGRFVRFLPAGAKVDLTQTARYAEALAERENFERFCALALGADAATLEQIVNRPIYPDRVPLAFP